MCVCMYVAQNPNCLSIKCVGIANVYVFLYFSEHNVLRLTILWIPWSIRAYLLQSPFIGSFIVLNFFLFLILFLQGQSDLSGSLYSSQKIGRTSKSKCYDYGPRLTI